MRENSARSKDVFRRRAAGLFLAACLLLIAAAPVVHPAPSYGSISTINGSAYLQEQYDDNIFLTPNDRVYDYKTTFIPTFGVLYQTTWLDLKVDEKFFLWHYARQDTTFYSNELDFESRLTLIKNFLYLDVNDIYASVVLEPRRPSTTLNLNVNRTDANVVNAGPYIKYDISPASSIIAGGAYTNIWYRQEGVNRDQYSGYLKVRQGFSPIFSAIVGGGYLADRPTTAFANVSGAVRQRANDREAAFASISTVITPRLRFGALGGYKWVRFTNGRDYNRPVYSGGLAYDLPANGKVELKAASEFATTPLFGVVRSEKQEAFIRYYLSPTVSSLKAGVFHSEDRYAEVTRTDEALGVTAGFEYDPLPRLKWMLNGGYEKDRYAPDGIRREIYNASTELDYKITPKITFGLTYNYNHSRGGFATDRYFDNLAGVQLKAEL